jgi:hypothetical protein
MKNLIKYTKHNFLQLFENFTITEFRELQNNSKTYIKRLSINNLSLMIDFSKYPNLEKCFNYIKEYDIENKFFIDYKYGSYKIYPDNTFIKLLYNNSDYFNDFNIQNLYFIITITNVKNLYINSIDIGDTIPTKLHNLGIARKLYNLVISKAKFITTNNYANPIMYNIWHNLMVRNDLYAFTSNFMSGIIDKNINDTNLKNILDDLLFFKKKYNLIFDTDLKNKIIEIYGNVESYS